MDNATRRKGNRANKFRYARERIERLVSSAPPLTREQLESLAAMLLAERPEDDDVRGTE